MIDLRPLALCASLLASATAGTAAADTAIEVGVGRTALVKLSRPAASVVVGDPGVADVSVEGPNRVVVFGKRAGGTSLTVLGAGDTVLADTRIVVHPGGSGGVTVTYGSGKSIGLGGHTVVYACGATCSLAAPETSAPAAKPASE